ncbi:DUF1348 family protein [Zobellia alginiliquefaciens]|uniref:DUF1348 family protein n=1 Tax=Zobellia alginiliquefaciens TaxID=3032586 RepID=UPI0023E3D081|nr:DUF1348 family protein [Zobellia alginiliquefaciens]
MKPTPFHPFSMETAKQKIKQAEDAWNTKCPTNVLSHFSIHSKWHKGPLLIKGHEAIEVYLKDKWKNEDCFLLKLEYWAHTDMSIAVQLAYEFRDEDQLWYRAFGNEIWEFDKTGLIHNRFIRVNDFPIEEEERQLHLEHVSFS